MGERAPHVTVETRRVYFGGEKHKLTRHAAYVAAAKRMIALACLAEHEGRFSAWNAECDAAGEWRAPQPGRCDRGSAFKCRFHKHYEPESYDYDGEPIGPTGMAHYVRVLPRLVRFLKFVDGWHRG